VNEVEMKDNSKMTMRCKSEQGQEDNGMCKQSKKGMIEEKERF